MDGIDVARYIYNAFGNISVYKYSSDNNDSSIGNINPFRYKWYYYDFETNLYYCNLRFHNPEVCRWISKDEISYY